MIKINKKEILVLYVTNMERTVNKNKENQPIDMALFLSNMYRSRNIKCNNIKISSTKIERNTRCPEKARINREYLIYQYFTKISLTIYIFSLGLVITLEGLMVN